MCQKNTCILFQVILLFSKGCREVTKELSFKNLIIELTTKDRTSRVGVSIISFVISFLKLNIFVN